MKSTQTSLLSRLSLVLMILVAAGQLAVADVQPVATGAEARAYSVQVLTRLAEPVLTALSENKLTERMPVRDWERNRRPYAHLEALGRLLSGMAPWLELGPDDSAEGKLRARYIQLAVKSIGNGVDPHSPDFLNFARGSQPLVDTAFLAHALVRAPKQLWGNLDETQRSNVVAAFKTTRRIQPGNNNWVLFSAMIETALWKYTGECEMKPIETAVEKIFGWYEGDGVYGDGPEFHWDYYNSYVIHPMLLDVLRTCVEKNHPLGQKYPLALERARRYAEIQERLISPEATYPILGRSSTYRFGAFQTLSQIALLRQLLPETKPGAVRAGLTAVIRRMIETPGTFDETGWLRVGTVGYQPSIRDNYISTGSLYLCSVGLLHLGLPADDPFWTEPDLPWTQKKIWSGQDVPANHALRATPK